MDPVILCTTLALMFMPLPPLSIVPIVVYVVRCVLGFSDPNVTKLISDSSLLFRLNFFAKASVIKVLRMPVFKQHSHALYLISYSIGDISENEIKMKKYP